MKDISVSFVVTGLMQVLNIATGLLAARLLLPEGRGELAAVMLWPGLIAELGHIGLFDALLYRAATRAAPPRELFASIMTLAAGLTVALVAVGLVVIPVVFAGYSAGIQALALVNLVAFLPVYHAALFINGMFQGHLRLMLWNLHRAIVPVGYLAGIAGLWLTHGASVDSFVAANIFGQSVAIVVGLALLARLGWLGGRPRLDLMRGFVAYGAKVHVGEMMYSLRSRLDQALVSLWLPAAELGMYVVALTVANGPLILATTIGNVAFPKISQQATHEGKALVFGRYLRLSIALSSGTILALGAVLPWILPLLFGESFRPAVPVAAILLSGLLPLAARIMCQQALKSWDRPLVIWRAELVGLIAAGAALALLIPTFGIIGAAWSVVASQIASAGVMGWSLHRGLGLNLFVLLVPTADDWALARRGLVRALKTVGLGHG